MHLSLKKWMPGYAKRWLLQLLPILFFLAYSLEAGACNLPVVSVQSCFSSTSWETSGSNYTMIKNVCAGFPITVDVRCIGQSYLDPTDTICIYEIVGGVEVQVYCEQFGPNLNFTPIEGKTYTVKVLQPGSVGTSFEVKFEAVNCHDFEVEQPYVTNRRPNTDCNALYYGDEINFSMPLIDPSIVTNCEYQVEYKFGDNGDWEIAGTTSISHTYDNTNTDPCNPCTDYVVSVRLIQDPYCLESDCPELLEFSKTITVCDNREFYAASDSSDFITYCPDDSCVTLGHNPFTDPCYYQGYTFEWIVRDGFQNPIDTLPGLIQQLCPPSVSNLTLVMTDPNGCQFSKEVYLAKSSCCPDPCFDLPDTLCFGAPVIPNLSCMDQNISRYRWGIHRISPTSGSLYHSGIINGPVQNINLSDYENFEAGATYNINLIVWKDCGDGTSKSENHYEQIFIAPAPHQMIAESISLSCEDDCATLSFNPNLSQDDGTEGPYSIVWDDGSTSLSRVVCPNGPSLYSATITNKWGCSSTWVWGVDKDTCCLDPCFDLPDTVCEGQPIIPDLSCMQTDIDSYRWAIHEMDPPNPWIPVYYSNYLPGPVAPVDFTTLYSGFEAGKSYGIAIDVFKSCGANTTINHKVYIAPIPVQNVSVSVSMGCDDDCTLLTFDPAQSGDGGNAGPYSIVWSDGNTSPTRMVCPGAPTSYTATVTNKWGCSSTWTWNVDKDTCCLNPCFDLPDTVCVGQPIIPDLSCMQIDIDSYRWAIHEMDPPNPWIPVYYSNYLPGPVAPVDFTTLYSGFEAGKSYGISIDVFKACGANTTIWHEVYISPKPTQPSVPLISLSCEDDCIILSFNPYVAGDGGSEGPYSIVWDDGSTSYSRNVCPDAPTWYSATVTNKHGCSSTWVWSVDKDTCCLDPCFDLPDTVCAGQPIIPDLSCMGDNVDTYRWIVQEMTPESGWIEVYSGSYTGGPVTPVDIKGLYGGFQDGRLYRISIEAYNDCGMSVTVYKDIYIQTATIIERSFCPSDETPVRLEPCPGAIGPFEYNYNGQVTISFAPYLDVMLVPGYPVSVTSYGASGCPCIVSYIAQAPTPVGVFDLWCQGETEYNIGSILDSTCLELTDSVVITNIHTGEKHPTLLTDPMGGGNFFSTYGNGDLACLQAIGYRDGCPVCILNLSLKFTTNCNDPFEVWCDFPGVNKSGVTNTWPASLEEDQFVPVIVPNPTSALFRIEPLHGGEVVTYDRVLITAMSGKLVTSLTSVQSDRLYDLSELATGMYFVTVSYQSDTYSLKLILKE